MSKSANAKLTLRPQPLPRSFYEPSAAIVAPQLLGHLLLRRTPRGDWAGGIIVETEAYLTNDPACHGYRRETPRNRSMYGRPGHAYVYFIYGNYFCFNAVCAPKCVAEAVLIRAIEPTFEEDWMRANRPVRERKERTAGPAKLCLALDIKREHDGLDICNPKSGLIIAHNDDAAHFVHQHKPLVTTTRIGLSVAGDLPLRFYLERSAFVSRRDKLKEVPGAPVSNGSPGHNVRNR
jgi:DNA-3-methyladenine glycosylase